MRNNKGSYNVTGDAKGIKVTPKAKPKAKVAPKPQPTAFVHNRTDRPTMRQLQQQGMQGMSVEDAKAQVANPPRNKGFQGIYKSSPEQKAELARLRKAYLESQGE